MAHTHDVYDMENHFEINGSSRFIKETSETKLVVVQGDHKSEVLTFKMPRYIDGHDMTLCNKIRIHYINLDTKTNNKSADVYEVTDLTLCEECEDVLTFTWTIEAPATKYSGTLSFLVKFECTEGENVLYQWNTAKYVSVNVLAGIDNSEEFVEKYSNVLEEWYNELTKGADSIEELNQQAIAEIELAKEDAKENIQGKANSTMAEMNQFSSNAYNSFKNDVDEKTARTLESIPEDYTELDGDVKDLVKITEKIPYYCLDDKLKDFFDANKEEIIPTWNKTDSYYTRNLDEIVLENACRFELDVAFGDLLFLTSYSNYEMCRYIIVDSDNNVLSYNESADAMLYTDTVIEIPTNASKIIFQSMIEYTTIFGLYKVVSFGIKQNSISNNMLKDETVSIEKLSKELQDSFVPMFEEIKPDFTENSGSFLSVDRNTKIFKEFDEDGYSWAVIPVLEGQIYKVHGRHGWSGFCFALADEFNRLTRDDGQSNDTDTEVIETIEIQANEKYLYINNYGFKTLMKCVKYQNNNPLYGKNIVYDGDSISESRSNNGGGFAKLIENLTGGNCVNQAVGGGILRSSSALGLTAHSVVDNLPNLPIDADLYCFEGGINDYWGNAELGTFSKSDYTGELDTTTVCGALEYIFRYALNTFVGKPICFVIVHKVQTTAYNKNASGDTFEDYRNAMVGICNKYSIPYYDGFTESGLNGWNEVQNQNFLTNADGCHPNEEGYKRYYVPQLIALFEKIMPRI